MDQLLYLALLIVASVFLLKRFRKNDEEKDDNE